MSGSPSPRLFIGGLKRNVEKEELMEEFKEFGEITDMWIAYDPPGFAFLEFATVEAAAAALETKHKKDCFGSEIRVEFTKKKNDLKKEHEVRDSGKPRFDKGRAGGNHIKARGGGGQGNAQKYSSLNIFFIF